VTVQAPKSEARLRPHAVSWTEIEGLVELIAEQGLKRNVDTVVGIARSGLVPAVMLSHRMGIRSFAVMDIARTASDEVDAEKSDPRLHGILNRDLLTGRRLLLVDDIVGAGLTMQTACATLREIKAEIVTAALVVNQRNLGPIAPTSVVDIVGCVVHGWVIFPWEGKDVTTYA
jgi:hypoxanthine phosphoribosyltransferase